MRHARSNGHQCHTALPSPWKQTIAAPSPSGFEEPAPRVATSYAPVVLRESFDDLVTRMRAAKDGLLARQRALLEERYDLSDRPAEGITMSRGKAVQAGVRVKLPTGDLPDHAPGPR